jgi:hypothetical protein
MIEFLLFCLLLKYLRHGFISCYIDTLLVNEYIGFSWREQQNSDDRYTVHTQSITIDLKFYTFLILRVSFNMFEMLQHVLVLQTPMLKRH